MKSLRPYLIICLLLVCSSDLSLAQSASDSSREPLQERHFRFGLGVSLEPALLGMQDIYIFEGDYYAHGILPPEYASAPVNIYLPIKLTERLRLEPILGYYAYKNMRTMRSPAYATFVASTSSTTERLSLFHVGVRLHVLFPIAEHFQVYVGPQVGYVVQKEESDWSNVAATSTSSEYTTTLPAYIAGLALGGEYYPMAAFSVGGEVALRFTWYGNPVITHRVTPEPVPSTPSGTIEVDRQFFTTGALFFVRWYIL